MEVASGSSKDVRGKRWATLVKLILLSLTSQQDMNRYPSTVVKVAFDGPDIHEEALFHLFRVCPLSSASHAT